MPENTDWVHPLDALAIRTPLAGASVRVIVMTADEPDRARSIGEGLVKLLGQRGRRATSVVVRPDVHGWNRALEGGLAEGDEPIVIVTTATAPWASGHLDPLLKAIDGRDHAIGRRPRARVGSILRRLATLPYRVLFAVPVADVYSPARIHRREKLAAIPLQSGTRFLDVEILAKATFFVQTIEEVAVPDLPSPPVGPVGHDLKAVFSRPVLKPGEGGDGRRLEPDASASGPSEGPEGEGERHDAPGREDGERPEDVAVQKDRPFEHHAPQGVQELGER